MAHLKRLVAPAFWRTPKKGSTWVVTPHPGPHPKFQSIPLSIIIKSFLKLGDTTTEAQKIIRTGEVFVDGKRRKDYAYPAGLFDVVTVPKTNSFYRLISSKKGLDILETNKADASLKIFGIKSKTVLKGNKMQLNLHDGKNITVEKGNYKTGDSLLLELPSLKVVEHVPFEKGATIMVTKGADSGKMGKVKSTIKGNMRENEKVVCVIDKEDRIIGKNSLIVIGKEKSAIKVE
ncbi:MAG: 30S ribosomal protein S4e [Candidatus Aenigmarchaeota archaeon]|nr:30S ribosomal protein S4e [Candidatus Aenigmarchaeota archaeon]